MAEEFRYALIVLGVLAMAGLALHGWWSARKASQQAQSRYVPEDKSGPPPEGFDEYGVGKPRKLAPGEKPQPKPAPTVAPRSDRLREPAKKFREDREKAPTLHEEPSLSFSADDDTDAGSEPQVADDGPSEVLILYVLLPEGQEINGAMLLPSLLTLGFKYGEMNIFHRHHDNAGSGGVLFSLANMFNPGTFDLEEMDKLQTRGLSLFMTLPGPGEALQSFNLMHNAARKLADEFGGQVLDNTRSVLTVQTTRHYVEKIREFQRQRLIRS
jgi:cell division protein ZipA